MLCSPRSFFIWGTAQYCLVNKICKYSIMQNFPLFCCTTHTGPNAMFDTHALGAVYRTQPMLEWHCPIQCACPCSTDAQKIGYHRCLCIQKAILQKGNDLLEFVCLNHNTGWQLGEGKIGRDGGRWDYYFNPLFLDPSAAVFCKGFAVIVTHYLSKAAHPKCLINQSGKLPLN